MGIVFIGFETIWIIIRVFKPPLETIDLIPQPVRFLEKLRRIRFARFKPAVVEFNKRRSAMVPRTCQSGLGCLHAD